MTKEGYCEGCNNVKGCVTCVDGDQWAHYKEAEQKPKQEWSEKDEVMAEDLIKGCVSAEKAHHFLHTPKEVADWLKSLKDRIGG